MALVSSLKWHRGIVVATTVLLLLLLSCPRYSYGQEAALADSDTVCEDVTDLDLNASLEDLDQEKNVDVAGGVDDVDDKTVEEPAPVAARDDEDAIKNTEATATDEVESSSADEEETATESDVASSDSEAETQAESAPPVQSGPFIDLLGDLLLSLEMVDETHAQVQQHLTNEALSGKKVVGLYFSADWCGPCKQFTPELVDFYNKMNSRRGKQNEFEIVWISRCRTVDDFGQYFTQMNWLALPPDEATGQRGQLLGEKYKVKGIPSLVLLDEVGNVITLDGRTKLATDRAGIGFPWRSPLSMLISALVPKSFRLMIKNQFAGVLVLVKGVLLGKK